jgi:PST family polysaccharide transporter
VEAKSMTDEPAPPFPRADAVPAGPEIVSAVRRGTRVVLLAQVVSQLISIGVLAAMLRLVAPGDHGLLAMVLPVVLLPRMAATLGLSTAVLHRDLSPAELSRVFWLNVAWGLVAATATAAGGLWLSWAYDQPLLGPLALSLAGTTLVAALANQHQALLERKLRLAPLAGVRLAAQVCGGLAGIYAARRGAGVWALVAQQYGELVVLAIWVWMLEPWRPAWPQRGAAAGDLVRFSGYYSASQLVYYVAQNLDKILLPILLGPAASWIVGLYARAFDVMMKPVYLLTSPLTGVMVAGLSQARADRAAHTALVARFFRLVGFGLFPCAVGLALVAPDVMTVLGGSRWHAAGRILSALAPAILVQGLVNVGMHVFASAGRSGRLLAATCLLCLVLVLGSLGGFYLGRSHLAGQVGDPAIAAAIGMAAGYSTVLVFVWFVPYLWLCLRNVDVRLADVLPPLWPALRAALVMGLVVWAIGGLPPMRMMDAAWRLAILIATGASAYTMLAWQELAWCWRELIVGDEAGR